MGNDFVNYRYAILFQHCTQLCQISTSVPGSSLSLAGSGHVAPRLWVVTNKINVADVLKIDSCSYLAKFREEKIMFSLKQKHNFDYFICYQGRT